MSRTRDEDREYKRKYRQRKRAEQLNIAAELLGPAGDTPKEIGQAIVRHLRAAPPLPPMERGKENFECVRAELDALGEVAILRSGLAQSALAMARILDNPDTWQHPAAANQLRSALLELHKASEAKPAETGKLAELRAARRRRDGIING